MKISALKSKIHRAVITQAELDYVGSITIDEDLMDAAGIFEYEHVHIVNINSGSRIETYVIAGKRGSGVICLNGAAARSGQRGDHIIIMSYADMSPEELKENPPRVVFVDDNNKAVRTARYEKHGRLENNNIKSDGVLLCENSVSDNGNCFGNSDKWRLFLENNACATLDYTRNGITIRVSDSGSKPVKLYHVQGIYSDISLMKDNVYRIEFDYESSGNMSFAFAVQQNYDPWNWYYGKSIKSSECKGHYSGYFTMPVDDDNVSVVFSCCKNMEGMPYSVTIENVSLTSCETD